MHVELRAGEANAGVGTVVVRSLSKFRFNVKASYLQKRKLMIERQIEAKLEEER